MTLTFGTGLFWLLLASTVGETIVRSARALRARRGDSALDTTQARRLAEIEASVATLTEALHAQDGEVARLSERLEFTERLLATPRPDRAQP